MNPKPIFQISNTSGFTEKALEIFRYQAKNNPVYRLFLSYLNVNPEQITSLDAIPFLPIQFFKSHRIVTGSTKEEITFLSSGTTGTVPSRHFVTNLHIYEESFLAGFTRFYGPVEDYHILALLPSYLERKGSSLVYMVDRLIAKSGSKNSGFYLNDLDKLAEKIRFLEAKNEKTLLIGVSYALIDLIEKYRFKLKNTLVMETGGMKGRRREMIKNELHAVLRSGFGVNQIHSEYGMTELLSQAYAKENGRFFTPPWMKILIRDTEDALYLLPEGRSGGINVIDLANINSCAFIATQDLGKIHPDGSFEVLGRFDNSDIRGCNLMVF